MSYRWRLKDHIIKNDHKSDVDLASLRRDELANLPLPLWIVLLEPNAQRLMEKTYGKLNQDNT